MALARDIFCNYDDTVKQDFEQDAKIMRNGKEVLIQDHVENFKTDCEIYSIIEKYGSVDKIPLDTQVIEGDLSNIKNLRDLKEAQIKAEKLWYELPIDVRKDFENDINLFRKDGLKYFQNLNKKAIEQAQTTTETQSTGGDVNNA